MRKEQGDKYGLEAEIKRYIMDRLHYQSGSMKLALQ